MDKIFIEVIAVFTKEGNKIPLQIKWQNGQKYTIDRVMDITKAASLKVGGRGIRYRCRIRGKDINLFLEDDKWFVEV